MKDNINKQNCVTVLVLVRKKIAYSRLFEMSQKPHPLNPMIIDELVHSVSLHFQASYPPSIFVSDSQETSRKVG